MIEINIGALVVLLGIPTAATGFCFWMLEHRIQKREKQKEAEEAKRQKEAAARERAREDLQIITIQGTSAAIALGEATARAVQRIPDAHCNGGYARGPRLRCQNQTRAEGLPHQSGDPRDHRLRR